MLSDYLPILVLFILAGGIVLLILVLSHILGPKNPNPHKEDPFECGSETFEEARQRFPVKFYVVAILFILFDVEVILLVPWAVLARDLGLVGFGVMFVFVLVLTIGLIYEWRKGALEWE